MDNIKNIRQRNLQKRKLKLEKLHAKEKHNSKKNLYKIRKHEAFSKDFAKKKNNFIDSKIKFITKKYDKKILVEKNKLKALKKSSQNKKNVLSKKILDIYSKKLEQLKNNNGTSEEIKIQESKIKNVSLMTLEELIIENSLIYKYYRIRKKLISKKYDKKIEKLKYNLSIAKITEEDFNEKNNNIEIDRHLNWDFFNRKQKNIKNVIIPINRLLNKIKHLEELKQNEINDIDKQKKHTPANNFFNAIKDSLETFKSTYIFGHSIKNLIQSTSGHLRRYSMIYILFFVVGIFYFMTSGTNLRPNQFRLILQSNAFILIIGMAMLMVIVAGYIDLSVGSLMGFLGAFSVVMFNKTGNLSASILLTIGVGALVGLGQGILIGYFKIPSFIVTLGSMLLFKGMILWITQSKTIIPNTEEYANFIIGHILDIKIGKFHIFSFLIVLVFGIITISLLMFSRTKKIKYGIVNDSNTSFWIKILFILGMFSFFAYLMGYSLFGLHYYVIYIMILAIIFIFVMQNTSFGRKIYSIGGNSKAAILSGINKGRITTYVFIITGMTVGFASIVFTGIATSANPQVSGQGYELDVISSVFVGGASMSGGIGTIQGTLIGGLILGFINNGMSLMNMGIQMQYIIKSIVLVTAVGYDIFSNRKIG